jgi:hypothetical protein
VISAQNGAGCTTDSQELFLEKNKGMKAYVNDTKCHELSRSWLRWDALPPFRRLQQTQLTKLSLVCVKMTLLFS